MVKHYDTTIFPDTMFYIKHAETFVKHHGTLMKHCNTRGTSRGKKTAFTLKSQSDIVRRESNNKKNSPCGIIMATSDESNL